MIRVVERCPACGVEHDHPTGGACEACHTPVRMWCRAHSGEIGWLRETPCPRCLEEATRSVPVSASPTLPASAPPRHPAPRLTPTPPARLPRDAMAGTRPAPAGRRGDTDETPLTGKQLLLLAGAGAFGLLVALVGFAVLWETGVRYGDALAVLGLACVFAGSLVALGMVVNAVRRRLRRA
ncbi:MAG TPA: hypothetical protein VHG93_02715 [Longimicrobium sp.]|nr:hypothetical protein [Longimicrobium sp.]